MSRMSGVIAAAGLAFINTVGISGNFVGPFVYGRIEEATGSLTVPYYSIAGAAGVGLALVPLLVMAMRRDNGLRRHP